MEEENKEVKELKGNEKVKEEVSKAIENIINDGIDTGNLDTLGKLIDIHKDIENEEYWNVKKEAMQMNYRGYGANSYGNYGNYDEYGENYGRRGVKGTGRGRRYRGGYDEAEEKIEEMREHYGAYSEGREQYNRGNYGAKQESTEGLENMMMSISECVGMIFEEAEPQEKQIIKRHVQQMARQMGEM